MKRTLIFIFSGLAFIATLSMQSLAHAASPIECDQSCQNDLSEIRVDVNNLVPHLAGQGTLMIMINKDYIAIQTSPAKPGAVMAWSIFSLETQNLVTSVFSKAANIQLNGHLLTLKNTQENHWGPRLSQMNGDRTIDLRMVN